ncbi:MAG: hypothetical protein JO344_13135 [Planctomycetaceae bacterium]|nr:hypothetical protein [Planctomycetaceae bacterium]
MKPRWPTTLASKSSEIARKVCGLLVVLLALSSPAIAANGHGHGHGGGGGGGGGGGSGGGHGSPEIDPGALSGALTLLASGTLILTDRFRRK